MALRAAAFAGSWYPDSRIITSSVIPQPNALGEELERLFAAWSSEQHPRSGLHPSCSNAPRAIIVPHAGYRYSGSTAIHGYQALARREGGWRRIILLGPSHRTRLETICQYSTFQQAETPLGTLKIARLPDHLTATSRHFSPTPRDVDQREHSLEIQFPLIRHFCPDAEIIPLLVRGSKNSSVREACAAELAELLRAGEETTALVISSDFCHWGASYGYHPRLSDLSGTTMSDRIRSLDEQALAAIANLDVEGLLRHLSETGNTICGCDAILLGMSALSKLGKSGCWQWLGYHQSSSLQCYDPASYSVSYVAGAFSLDDRGRE